VSRSPVMSKADCNTRAPPFIKDNKKPIPGSSGDGFQVPSQKALNREKHLTVSPLLYEVRHHHELLTRGCDIANEYGRVQLAPSSGPALAHPS
jgi:hypothetical protein